MRADRVTTEDELVRGYAGGMWEPLPLVAPCACGTDVVCVPDDVPIGVAAHNALPEHQAWRAAGGMERELDEHPWRRPGWMAPSGFCSAHRDGEDPTCRTCYPGPKP